MSIKVTFGIDFFDETIVTEDELETDLEFYRLKFQESSSREGSYGAVTIKAPGQKKIKIWDELYPIIYVVCFSSINHLIMNRNEECLLYKYSSSDARLVLLPSESHVRIFGEADDVPSGLFEKDELVGAFYHCGQRYLNLLRRLEEKQVAHFYYADLEIVAEEARKVLTEYELL
jgi:hypothetical protein